ncbi:MAG: aldo/keto reductase [Anaerolineae bacterium]
MDYRKLGNTGLKISELCLGTMTFLWTTDEPGSFAVLNAFAEAGGNFLDTADIYSRWAPNNPGGTAELVIGKWLKQAGRPREQFVIATKGRGPMGDGPNDQGASRAHLIHAVEASLRRLQTDYIDLYQIHWWDETTPLEETLRALDDLVSAGKVRYIGASNFPAWYLTKALWISDVRNYVRFESIQPHYNLMHRDEFEREMMALCRDQRLGVIPYSPLAGGFLTGKYRKGQPIPAGSRGENNPRIRKYAESERGQNTLGRLEEIGHSHGKSILQTALAWMLSNPVITAPIIGAGSVEQLKESLGAVGYRLSDAEIAALNDVSAAPTDI